MIQSIFSAETGLVAQQKRLDTIGNNIANFNTQGFKSRRIDFEDCVTNTMESPLQPQDDRDLERNVGVLVSSTKLDLQQGALLETGNFTDLALTGEGFFSVRNFDGETVYTRGGSFQYSEEDGIDYLTDHNGFYLLDENGQRIGVENPTELVVTPDGEFMDDDGVFARIQTVTFPNAEGLVELGGSCYGVSENSGDPVPTDDCNIMQGFMERSNVDLAQEMALLIRTQRAYSLASRALQTADSMDGLANNMRN